MIPPWPRIEIVDISPELKQDLKVSLIQSNEACNIEKSSIITGCSDITEKWAFLLFTPPTHALYRLTSTNESHILGLGWTRPNKPKHNKQSPNKPYIDV
jgi:hypothetical protein